MENKIQDVKVVVTMTCEKNCEPTIEITDESVNPPDNMLNKAVLMAVSKTIGILFGSKS